MHVREVGQISSNDEQVQRSLMNLRKGADRFRRLWMANLNLQRFRSLAARTWNLGRLQFVRAMSLCWNAHQLHRTDWTLSGIGRTDVGMHGTPESIGPCAWSLDGRSIAVRGNPQYRQQHDYQERMAHGTNYKEVASHTMARG